MSVGISVVQGSPQSVWMPLETGATVHVGSLVMKTTASPTEGVLTLADSAGVYNETNCNVPLGVCIGTNRKNPLYSSTYLTEYITEPGEADPHGGASIEYVGVEGPWAKGDPIAMVKVALIDPSTVLRAPIRNAAIGTAPTLLTATNVTHDADGKGVTTNTSECASITTPLSTIYCRTGANAGAYRLCDTASASIHAWDTAMRNDCVYGDTFVLVPVRTHGLSTVMFDATTAMFIDSADDPVANGTARWGINVVRLDLSTAGNEYCEFSFLTNHFQMVPTFV